MPGWYFSTSIVSAPAWRTTWDWARRSGHLSLAAIQEGRIKTSSGVKGPHLVVVPTSLLFNWEQELARFAPGLKVHAYSGSERTLDAKDGEVVITTYGLVRRDIDILERMAFHIIVFDEAQAVKNISADTTGAVRRLKGRFKLTLTGTPLENHLGEYFSVIDLCMPGLLGDYDRFKPQLKRVEGRALERLLHRTRPFILRRTKAEILHDLPQKIESEVFLDLTDRQRRSISRRLLKFAPRLTRPTARRPPARRSSSR